ncbi:MAG: methylaspartate mutase subunit S [Chloroflexi bacterium]|nr:methylaspartate mutase subunit S [Chloroflexota bacterium]
MPTETAEKKTIVLGTIGCDAHIVGATILAHALREAGFNVIHLGAIVSQEEFVNAAKETAADAICVSSVYGMGLLDCEGFKEKLVEAGLGHVKLYIGGLLTATELTWEETERRFKKLGFDRVYPPGTMPDRPIADLKKDLAAKTGRSSK